MLYTEWGFRKNPFETTSLPSNEEGLRLLVGRDNTLAMLARRIKNPPKITTLEGMNGVGKTSVLNVAMYRLFKGDYNVGDDALFIPCRKAFQLNTLEDASTFKTTVLMEVAQTLIDKKTDLEYFTDSTRKFYNKGIDRWLNSPQLVSYQGGAWIIPGGVSRENNTSSGFDKSGFEKAVVTWLENVFPSPSTGGVVCIIDNLELLQSSEKARQTLEQLRDSVLNLPGIRWVLCGALGIVHGVVSSPRLEGILHKPIEVGGIGKEHAGQVFSSRIEAFKQKEDYYLPLTEQQFLKLYDVLRGNLRSVLSSCDDYCNWATDTAIPEYKEISTVFDEWLMSQAHAAYSTAQSELRPRPLKVLFKAYEKELFSPGDYEEFGFKRIEALRPHIRDLESVGLLVSTQDEKDKRRKTIQVTPKGWLVKYFLDEEKKSQLSLI